MNRKDRKMGSRRGSLARMAQGWRQAAAIVSIACGALLPGIAVAAMRTSPVGRRSLIPILVPIAVPMLVVVALQVPLKDVLVKLVRAVL